MRHFWAKFAIFSYFFWASSSFAISPIITCPGPYACILTSYLGLKFPDGTNQTTAATTGPSYTFSSPLLNTSSTISILQSSGSQNGYLSSSDWTLFNNKQTALSFGSFSTSTTGITILNGSSSTVGPNVSLNIQTASTSQPGFLSASDWNLFNGKQSGLTFGSISTSTTGFSIVNGSSSTVGPNVTLNIQTSSGSQIGLLSAADWTTFNSKQSSLSFGNLSESTSNVLTISNGSGSVIGSGTGIQVKQSSSIQSGYLGSSDWSTFNAKQDALSFSSPLVNTTGTISIPASSTSVNGYLTSTDWNTFNGKQASGNYITALTSDVSASGPGSVAATVNSVGGSTALSVHTAELLANAATDSNTASAIVKRDGSGNFSAGTVTVSNATIGSLSGVLKASTGVVSGSATTTDLTEGSNLYFTTARAQSAVGSGVSAQQLYVSKDTGSDSNACTLASPCLTIQHTVTAANAIAAYYKQVDIHVSPSTGGTGSGYNETVTFSQQGVNLICDAPQANTRACFISGSIVVNVTGTSGGANYSAALNEVSMNGFVVSATSTTNALVFSGSTYQKLISINNYFDQTGTVSSAVISNSGTTGGTPSQVTSFDSTYSNSNATNPAVSITSGARFWMYGTTSTVANGNASGPSVTQSGAASSAIFNLVQLTGQYNLSSNTATATFNLSTIASGTNPCIVTPSSANVGYALLAYFGCNSSNTNSITGSGVVANAPGNIRISTSGDIISTVTQITFPGLPQGEVMIGAGATTGTNVALSIKDGHIKVAQTTAPTATVNANAGTSATCTLSNGTDSAGKINLTTTATSPASGTQCTITFNKAYGVAPICVVSPNNNNSVLFAVTNGVFFTTTTTTLVVSYANADITGHANNWMYQCMETN